MTAFFVPERPGRRAEAVDPNRRTDIDALTLGKRAKLSFFEMNELRMVDLIDYARSYAGVEDDAPREATQADIDAFYRG